MLVQLAHDEIAVFPRPVGQTDVAGIWLDYQRQRFPRRQRFHLDEIHLRKVDRLAFGDADFLCSQIKQSDREEVGNFATAFGRDREASLKAIHALSEQSQSVQDWRLKARLAVVALHLGDASIADDMCRIENRPDPSQRTIFIDEFPMWHGDLAKLAAHCEKLSDSALRSAVCMAVGSTPGNTAAWKPFVSEWYQAAPENVTHSAAGWALSQWKVDLPPLATPSQPTQSHDWFKNSLGMTLLTIRPGQFVRRDSSVKDAKDQTEK